MMKLWLVRTEEDPTCKCTVEAATREEALARGADKTGCDADDLLAIESPFPKWSIPVEPYFVKVSCGGKVRTARLTHGEWSDLVRYAKTLCLPSNPPAFIVVGGIVVWSNER